MGKNPSTNKLKIINDPVYGFIKIPYDIVFDLIEHPLFQRLRRIRQLGLTQYVYPGANHTRFQHAVGAMYLMGQAIEVIRSKGMILQKMRLLQSQLPYCFMISGTDPFLTPWSIA